jgi:hypothetical protein
VSRVAALVAALVLAAAPVRAVDITGTWSMCLSGGGAFCPATLTGVLTSSGGQFTFDLRGEGTAIACVVSGTVDSGTGVLTVTDSTQCQVYAGLTATATDTSITGSFSFLLCSPYVLTGVKACAGCDDGNDCSVDGCGATACSEPASSCTEAYLPFGSACNDGQLCTVNDQCGLGGPGICGGEPKPCVDFNICTDSTCDPSDGHCIFIPNTKPCSDGDVCTANDTCSGGSCVPGPPLACNPCETCVSAGGAGCVVGPKPGCRHSIAPAKSKLALKDSSDDARDKVTWTWAAGEATSANAFLDPVADDDYTLCVYDDTSNPGMPRLFLQSTAPAGGSCANGGSCWIGKGNPPGSKGFLYKDSAILLPDGLKNVKLQPGASGRAKVKAKGQGPNLALPSPMNVTLPVVVQLRVENGQCFESTFTAAQVDQEDLFRAKASQ